MGGRRAHSLRFVPEIQCGVVEFSGFLLTWKSVNRNDKCIQVTGANYEILCILEDGSNALPRNDVFAALNMDNNTKILQCEFPRRPRP